MTYHFMDIDYRQEKIYEKYKPLWLTDDPSWIEKRKESWRIYSEKEQGYLPAVAKGKFYVYGEQPPSVIGEDVASGLKVDFSFRERIVFTPFQSSLQLEDFWETTCNYYNDGTLSDKHCSILTDTWNGLPDRDELLEFYIKTIFNEKYFMNKDSKGKLITVSPRGFIKNFTRVRRYFSTSCEYNLDYRLFTIPYFTACIEHCTEENNKDEFLRKVLKEMYSFLKKLEVGKLDNNRQYLRNQLIGLATTENSLSMLKNAYEEVK